MRMVNPLKDIQYLAVYHRSDGESHKSQLSSKSQYEQSKDFHQRRAKTRTKLVFSASFAVNDSI